MNWNKSIFLAHANEDKPIVRKIAKRLKEAGLEPWMDEESIQFGEKWSDVADNAIKKARFFMACLSSKSVSKDGYVQREFRLALSQLELKSPQSIYFIPALIEEVDLPNISVGTIHFGDYHAVKIFEEHEFNKLIQQLQKQANIDVKIKQRESPNFAELRTAIANGKLDSAIRILLEYVKTQDNDLQNSVTLLAARYNRISKDNLMGIVNQEQYAVENNRITYSLLETIKVLEEGNDG